MDQKIEENTQQSLFDQFKKNKTLVIILITALILGLYLRFDDYAAEGYNSDDTNTIPAAVFVYYPHDYFPGLVSTEPPLGNYIIGLGCMASGEDFSGVSKVKPLFFPDRSAYIGKAAKNAEKYCFAPVYIFGILFLIGAITFAFLFFQCIRSATYFIIFCTFFSGIIASSRILKPDIIFFTFAMFASAFLWKGYITEKGLFKEKLYFFFAFAFFGLAGATKFPAGALIIFSFLLLLEKYSRELFYLLQKSFNKIDIKILDNKIDKENINIKSLLVNIIISLFSSYFFLMLFFNFDIKNLLDTYHYMTSLNWADVQTLGFSIPSFLKWLEDLITKLGIIDFFIYLFSIYIFIKIIFKKSKTNQEKFAVYFVLLCLFLVIIFKSMVLSSVVHTIPFMLGFFILMSLTFSDKPYSIFSSFNINKKYFLIFIVGYLMISFLTLYFAPFHHVTSNPFVCSFTNLDHCKDFIGYPIKPVSLYFESVLNEDETFFQTGIFNFYTRHNDDILWWIFYSNFKKQTGQEPGLNDYLKYYHPENRRIRYIHTSPQISQNPADYIGIWGDTENLKKRYKPNHVISLYGKESAYIYDLDNLIKK